MPIMNLNQEVYFYIFSNTCSSLVQSKSIFNSQLLAIILYLFLKLHSTVASQLRYTMVPTRRYIYTVCQNIAQNMILFSHMFICYVFFLSYVVWVKQLLGEALSISSQIYAPTHYGAYNILLLLIIVNYYNLFFQEHNRSPDI